MINSHNLYTPHDRREAGKAVYLLCIYCRRVQDTSEFSLEHVIPQFLGGA